MVIICNRKPFEHIIIKDFFHSIAYEEVFNELRFLRPRMEGPESTGASASKQNPSETRKRGVGIFLNKIYQDLTQSSIFYHTRSLFSDEITSKMHKFADSNYYFRHWNRDTMRDSIIAQYYDHGDYYKSHTDTALFSAVTALYQKPKAFEGGRFVFPEFDYSVELEDNMTLIFPSVLTHEVEEIKIPTSGQMIGRFSITSFISQR